MKIILSETVLALNPKADAVIKILLRYGSNTAKRLQDAGTFGGLNHIASLSRTVVLKTVKDAARRGVFNSDDGGKANWAHSDFFDMYPYGDNEAWAEFLLALVFDPANKREKTEIYDRLLSFKFKGQAAAVVASETVAFFGKIREELRKRTIRNKIRQGGLREQRMEEKPSAMKQHRLDKNNPWGLNVGYSSGKKAAKAASSEEAETRFNAFFSELKKVDAKIASFLFPEAEDFEKKGMTYIRHGRVNIELTDKDTGRSTLKITIPVMILDDEIVWRINTPESDAALAKSLVKLIGDDVGSLRYDANTFKPLL